MRKDCGRFRMNHRNSRRRKGCWRSERRGRSHLAPAAAQRGVTAESDWLELVRAESAYVDARRRLFEGDPTAVLRRGLGTGAPSATDRRLAIAVLEEFGGTRPDVVRDLVPELFELSLGMHANSTRVRRIVARLGSVTLEAELAPVVEEFLRDGDRDAQEYWGLMALLDETGVHALRDEVITRAASHPDRDVRAESRAWATEVGNRNGTSTSA